ncbi:MAG: hypothetical protein OXN17_12225 [Candidatus Poribacteria bacterium]|nr:hypothetical protein [Candidatus Poribacteria bacterium]MDE0505256.1 hypothetical protein [Candidatus Poribacteria bacterium]
MKYQIVCSMALFSLVTLLQWAPDANARAFRIAKLPGGGPNFGCAACHVNPGGGGARNSFGLDYEAIALAAGDVYTDELGQKDSDGDGFTNDEEFNADPATEPWNGDSHPPLMDVSVESIGKMFAIWARLKLEPMGVGRNLRPAAENTLRNPPTALQRPPTSANQRNSAVDGRDSLEAKNQPKSASKSSVTKNRKKPTVSKNVARTVRKS